MTEPFVRVVSSDETVLAYVIRGADPPATNFPLPAELPLQVGFIVYAAGGEVARHAHVPLDRHLDKTCEVLVVRSGGCEIDLYDQQRRLVTTEALEEGDIILLVEGGHGLRMKADTVLLEVKQGPYTGLGEKELF